MGVRWNRQCRTSSVLLSAEDMELCRRRRNHRDMVGNDQRVHLEDVEWPLEVVYGDVHTPCGRLPSITTEDVQSTGLFDTLVIRIFWRNNWTCCSVPMLAPFQTICFQLNKAVQEWCLGRCAIGESKALGARHHFEHLSVVRRSSKWDTFIHWVWMMGNGSGKRVNLQRTLKIALLAFAVALDRRALLEVVFTRSSERLCSIHQLEADDLRLSRLNSLALKMSACIFSTMEPRQAGLCVLGIDLKHPLLLYRQTVQALYLCELYAQRDLSFDGCTVGQRSLNFSQWGTGVSFASARSACTQRDTCLYLASLFLGCRPPSRPAGLWAGVSKRSWKSWGSAAPAQAGSEFPQGALRGSEQSIIRLLKERIAIPTLPTVMIGHEDQVATGCGGVLVRSAEDGLYDMNQLKATGQGSACLSVPELFLLSIVCDLQLLCWFSMTLVIDVHVCPRTLGPHGGTCGSVSVHC